MMAEPQKVLKFEIKPEEKILSANNTIPIWDKDSPKDQKYNELIMSLYNMIRMKDVKTANHCKAVAYYSNGIAAALGFSKADIHAINDAALLHDIGKILVDQSILNKNGKLTDRERYQMEGHTEDGMRILESFHVDDRVVDAAWHHHEKIDGSGYPDGLYDSDILEFTKIIAVADMTDAMSTNRPYRNKLSFDTVISELKKASGKQTDKKYTDIMIELLVTDQIYLMG